MPIRPAGKDGRSPAPTPAASRTSAPRALSSRLARAMASVRRPQPRRQSRPSRRRQSKIGRAQAVREALEYCPNLRAHAARGPCLPPLARLCAARRVKYRDRGSAGEKRVRQRSDRGGFWPARARSGLNSACKMGRRACAPGRGCAAGSLGLLTGLCPRDPPARPREGGAASAAPSSAK